MHRQAAVGANRLSLRHPQRSSLEILDRLCELVPPRKKARVARESCGHASEHARQHGTKRWRYALIAHDVLAENMSVAALVDGSRR